MRVEAFLHELRERFGGRRLLWQEIVAQVRAGYRLIALATSAAVVLLGTVLIVHLWTGVALGDLTRDPNAVAESPMYVGFLSQIGIFLWAACAAICLLCAVALPQSPELKVLRRFLHYSGAVNLLLGLDDALLFHEALPLFGIPEAVAIASYATLVFVYLIAFSPIVLKSNYLVLALALSFFGLSAALDVVKPGWVFREDAAKLLGLLLWQAYFASFTLESLKMHGTRQGAG